MSHVDNVKGYIVKSVGIPGWVIGLAFVVMLSGFGLYWWESQQFKKYQREVLEGELKRLVPIRDEIDSLNKVKRITMKDIQATQETLTRLKNKLDQDSTSSIDLDDALKIIGEFE